MRVQIVYTKTFANRTRKNQVWWLKNRVGATDPCKCCTSQRPLGQLSKLYVSLRFPRSPRDHSQAEITPMAATSAGGSAETEETEVAYGAEMQGGVLIGDGATIPASVLGDEMLSRASFSDASSLPANPEGMVPASPLCSPAEAVDFILTFMKRDARSEVQAKGCQALAQLAEKPEGRSAVLAVDSVAVVVEAMMSAADDEIELQTRGCAAISNFVVGGDGEAAVLEQGGLAAVLAAGKAHPKEAAVQRKCCAAVRASARCQAQSSGEPLAPELTALPRAHSQLGNIAFGSAGEVAVLAAGGLEIVVAAMKAHPSDAALQEEGVDALANIADGEAGKQQLLALGGLGVAAAAKKYSNCAETAGAVAAGLVEAAKAARA